MKESTHALDAVQVGAVQDVPIGTSREDFYRRIIEGMRCGILAIEREGRVALINDHARAILELPELPERGTTIEDALVDHPQLATILRESFSMSYLPNRAEIELHSRTSRGKTIGFTLSLVPGECGVPAGSALFFKDLTYVEHREEQERLKDRLAALGQMAANLAHEIRNPLASIEVTSSLLKRRLPAEDGAREMLDKIIAEVRRLNKTITSSLEFVKPLALTLAPASLATVLDDALGVALGRCGGPGLHVDRSGCPDGPVFLMDGGQLRQVFENLFLNALESMGEEGRLGIDVSTAKAPAAPMTPYRPAGTKAGASFESYAVIRVCDTGPGIPREHLEKLFHPFFTTKKHGSGVGLSMAKKIVDKHGGLIDVASEPGCGAVFTIRIPMMASSGVEMHA